MHKFERVTHTLVTTVLWIFIMICLCKRIEIICSNKIFLMDKANQYFCYSIFFLVIWVIALFFIPPDFEYYIKDNKDNIIFKNKNEDYIIIDKPFTITKDENPYYIVINDGFAKIRLPYDEEVLKFLNEIKN